MKEQPLTDLVYAGAGQHHLLSGLLRSGDDCVEIVMIVNRGDGGRLMRTTKGRSHEPAPGTTCKLTTDKQ